MSELKNVAIFGAGVMGAQIGLLCAECGFNVKIRDMEDPFLDTGRGIIDQHLGKRVKKKKMSKEQKEALMKSIVFTTDLKEAVEDADYIVESITDVLEFKQAVFKEAYEHAPRHCIFGTNTSTLLVSEIASAIPEPERVIALAEPDAFNEKVAEMARALADRGSLGQGIAKRVMYYGAQIAQ